MTSLSTHYYYYHDFKSKGTYSQSGILLKIFVIYLDKFTLEHTFFSLEMLRAYILDHSIQYSEIIFVCLTHEEVLCNMACLSASLADMATTRDCSKNFTNCFHNAENNITRKLKKLDFEFKKIVFSQKSKKPIFQCFFSLF